MDDSAEEWKAIPSCWGLYEASSSGRIRNATTQHVLKPNTNGGGYLDLNLYVGKKARKGRVHSLVAETFIGIRLQGYEVNHKDGDKRNNAVQNLEYVTHSENMLHIHRIGRGRPIAAIEASSRLREAILAIDPAIPTKAVARQLGISPAYVRRIRKRATQLVQ